MQSAPGDVVSVIIPCFNKGEVIQQTVASVISQSYQNLEIIVVDDGSTDDSESKINGFDDSRIIYIKQSNRGVSAARNEGLSRARGTYIVFFDSDDIMTEDFILKRLSFLRENPNYGFCAGLIFTFTKSIATHSNAIYPCYSNMVDEVVLFKEGRFSVPSNYMYRAELFHKNGIRFNEKLSSTADRFFLFEMGAVAECGLMTNGGQLFYRMSPDSMSNKLTPALVKDQVRFFEEVLKSPSLPEGKTAAVKWKRNQLLIGSFFLLKNYFSFTMRVFLSLFQFPAKTMRFLFSKMFRQSAS